MEKDDKEGQTHYYNDGCSCPEHNFYSKELLEKGEIKGQTEKTIESAKKLAHLMKKDLNNNIKNNIMDDFINSYNLDAVYKDGVKLDIADTLRKILDKYLE